MAQKIGSHRSEEIKRRISETCKKNGVGRWMQGRKALPETIEKRVSKIRGKKRPPVSEEFRQLQSIRLKKYFREHPEAREVLRQDNLKNPRRYWQGKKLPAHVIESMRLSGRARSEEKGSNWAGDDVGYDGIHQWIRKHKGKANICSFNSDHKDTFRYEWANISGSYLRNVDDFVSLCVKCHRHYDLVRSNYMFAGKYLYSST